jgi:prefoldin subunit 5
MQAYGHRIWVRTASIGMAIALLALLGGCARSASEQAPSSGGAGVAVAPLPAATDSGPSTTNQGYATGEAAAPSVAPSKDSATSIVSAPEKLVVVTKTLRIETESVDASLTKIRELAARDRGDITDMQVSTSVDQPVYPLAYDGAKSPSGSGGSSVPLRAYVTVRVPADTYAAFIADAAKLGKVLYQSESADDVTQQHVDMKARIGNLKAEQARLRQMFAKAKNVSDMLAVEQELSRVQGDIESMQAQIDFLERQAAMATVTIELVEPTPLISPSGTDWGIKAAFTGAVRAFVNTMNEIIVALGPIVALLVFVGLPVLLVIWVVRMMKRRARKALQPAPSAPTASDHQDGPVS